MRVSHSILKVCNSCQTHILLKVETAYSGHLSEVTEMADIA